jgi:two-component system, NtrC family, response regulator HydG
MNPKVLVIDDNEDVLVAAKLLLKPVSSIIITEKNPANLKNLLSEEPFDVIFLDMNFTEGVTTGNEGFNWLKEILKIDPNAVVILMTAYGDVETAVRAVKEGATDFVLKPWQNEKLLATFSSAVRFRESRLELGRIKTQQKFLNEEPEFGFNEIIGTSEPMKKVFNTIKKVAETDADVLILGENGTGKELIARAIHRNSKRVDNVFVSVDMGSISQSLFESELFGHVKGAFTDAKEERPGRFEIASGGTLFLDEIGNIPIELQSKLLAAIQKKEIIRVGSNKTIPVNIRLVCATNVLIYDLVAANKFRQDLLYRINTVEIHLPPLREKVSDIPLLVEYFFSYYKKKYNKLSLSIDPVTEVKLEKYSWPGNVRELQHAIERAVILCDGNSLYPSDFFFNASSQKNEESFFDDYNLEEVEKAVIKKVLLKYGGNITRAANILGLTRASLYRRMEKHGL